VSYVSGGDKQPSGLNETSPQLTRWRDIVITAYGPTLLVSIGQGRSFRSSRFQLEHLAQAWRLRRSWLL
jgi:hypothetical protein